MAAHPRISVCTSCTPGWPLADDLALYAELGVTTTTVEFTKVEACGLDAAVGLVAGSGVGVELLFPNRFGDLSAPGTWPAVQAHEVAVVEAAAALGARHVLIPGGTARGLRHEDAVAAAERLHAPARARAATLGVRLALEPLRPRFAHLGFVHALRDAEVVAPRLDMDLVVDTSHVWWEAGLAATLARVTPRVAIVQVADLGFDEPLATRRMPGDGDLPIAWLLDTLVSAGYTGRFDLEILGPVIDELGPAEVVRRGVAWLTSLLDARGW